MFKVAPVAAKMSGQDEATQQNTQQATQQATRKANAVASQNTHRGLQPS
jgi:hypothetical protein